MVSALRNMWKPSEAVVAEARFGMLVKLDTSYKDWRGGPVSEESHAVEKRTAK